jgi:hypothetical protein
MFETFILANWGIVSVDGPAQPAEHNAFRLRSIGLIDFEIWQNVSNTYSCKLNNCQCSRRSATSWAQRVDTQFDWHNSFCDMTKSLKPYSANWRNNSVVDATQPDQHKALTLMSIGSIEFEIWQNVWNTYSWKLSDCQSSRRSGTCWAQRVDIEVDWADTFWDMTKCLKPYSYKLKKQQCNRRSATCWAQRVDTNVDWPNNFRDMTKCLKHLFLQID